MLDRSNICKIMGSYFYNYRNSHDYFNIVLKTLNSFTIKNCQPIYVSESNEASTRFTFFISKIFNLYNV